MTPMPTWQKSFFESKGYFTNGELQYIDNVMTVYPEKVLSGKDYLTGEILLTEHTFSIHHYNASWISN